MQITKAVITAAGRGGRQYPTSDTVQKAMLPLVDRDGRTKPTLQIIAEEALASGIEELCVVTAPGDEEHYRRYFQSYATGLLSDDPGDGEGAEQSRTLSELGRRLRFAVQPEPEGYGHAVWCAREFIGDEPFLLLLGDHVYVSHETRSCARQLLDLAAEEGCSVSAVQATREHRINQFGTLSGRRLSERHDVYQIDEIIEKPTLTQAELKLHVPGLRVGHYLCFFGMHVLTPATIDLLSGLVGRDRREGGQIQLTTALNELAARERYLALETRGSRYNLGVKYGTVEAQIALSLAGVDREPFLAGLLESVIRIDQAAT
jgi:UTP--glucose-1-phosphate uridylyltransferase